MSRRSTQSSRVAYMEEEDDSGKVIGVTYAASAAPGSNKERMNTGKSRRGESPGPGHGHNDSDSTAHVRRGSRSKPSRERERSIPPVKKAVTLASRPSARTSRTAPDMETAHHHRRSRDEAEYYGIDPDSVTSTSSRPRSKTAAPRPSYTGYSRPPVSNSRYHQVGPSPPQYQPPPQFQTPQFQPLSQYQQPPPPMQSSYGAGAPLQPPSQAPLPWQPPSRYAPMGPPPPMSLPPATGPYPDSMPRPQSLQQRFDLPRPQTSVGHRPPHSVDDYAPSDGYFPEERQQLPDMRRLSLSAARPNSARLPPQDSPFAPPLHAPPRSQRITEYHPYADEPYDDESVFQDTASSYYDLPSTNYVPRKRRPSVGPTTVGYDSRTYGAEAPRSTGGRRDSLYSVRSVSGAGLEDKLRQASSYQEETSGGVRLTAATLDEANRVAGPRSRSTRSSGSRDESDWRNQSATTRTTRSSTAEDDRTMKVRGPAFIRMGETEVQCEIGAEVDITPSGITSSRRSERNNYIEADDHRSRFDRPALRNRAASQAASYTQHAIAPYEYSYGNGHDYARLPYNH